MALAIAAGLVLLLGGAAFAMKSTLMDYARGIKDGLTGSDTAYSDGVAVGKASNPIGSSQAASGEPSTVASLDLESTAAGSASADDVRSTDTAIEVAPIKPESGVSVAATSDSVSQSSSASGAASRPVAAAVAQRLEQRRDTVAKAAPVRPAPPPPRVAVIALGDGALTGPARQRVEERLMDAGFDVLDSDLVSGIGGRGDLPGIFNALRREASVVVVIRAEGVGSQELQYYGQSSTLFTANLTVRSYFVPEKRALGPGFRERIDFTTLNADTKAEEAVRPYLSGLVSELSPYRRKASG
jgi:serine/threonine-protein kinase